MKKKSVLSSVLGAVLDAVLCCTGCAISSRRSRLADYLAFGLSSPPPPPLFFGRWWMDGFSGGDIVAGVEVNTGSFGCIWGDGMGAFGV